MRNIIWHNWYINNTKKEGIQECSKTPNKKETTSRRKDKSLLKMSEKATDNKFFQREETF